MISYRKLSTYPRFETEARGTQKWPIRGGEGGLLERGAYYFSSPEKGGRAY